VTQESFAGLLVRHRGRTRLTQRDLAARAGASRRSVQDWESGVYCPDAGHLRAAIGVLLQEGGFSEEDALAEAEALWAAAMRETPRLRAPLDRAWFDSIRPRRRRSTGSLEASDRAHGTGSSQRLFQDWGEAPDTRDFVGRANELALLQRWVLEERRRVIAVLGFGGIGKTSLAAKLAQTVAAGFERVYWRSLRNAPTVTEWLAGAIDFLSDHQVTPPPAESERIAGLLQLLQTKRCLVVLDNCETLLEPGQHDGGYRAGMAGYGRLVQSVGEVAHQSCLLLTSREAPPELTTLGGGVGCLEIYGLGTAEIRSLLVDMQLVGDTQAWGSLVDHYGGNGLALKIVGTTIRQVYDGDVAAFVSDLFSTQGTIFGGIRRLLERQVERLSPREHEVFLRLAIEREPVSLGELVGERPRRTSVTALIEAIETLRRRSLVEPVGRGATFTLQSMVLEYTTDLLVETAVDEIERAQPKLLLELPLIKAQAKDYVREAQQRLIGTPILERLKTTRDRQEVERLLLALLEGWRTRRQAEQGYGPGGVVNLLRLLRGDLRGLNLSGLSIRHAYLRDVEAQDASLAGADLAGTVLADAFSDPSSVAISADGAYLVAGSATGEVYLWRLADRALQATLRGHTGTVWGVALSGDGRLIASGSLDGTVRLWAAATGECLATLNGHAGGIWGVALTTNGRLLASGSFDGTVRLWAPATGECLSILRGHADGVRGVALSADGQVVASGGQDGTIRLWSVESGQPLNVLRGHTAGVWAVALGGGLVASGSLDGTVRLWSLDSGKCLATLEGHSNGVWAVALSADGQLVASSSLDRTVRLWSAPGGRPLATLHGHSGPVTGVTLTGDGRTLATGSDDGSIRLWEADHGQPLATLQGHGSGVWSMALSADGRLLASGGQDGTVRLWGEDGQLLRVLRGHTGGVRSIAVRADGRVVASGGLDGTVRLWAVDSGQCLITIPAHSGGVRGLALSKDCQVIVSGGQDSTIRLWAASGRTLATLRAATGPVIHVGLSTDQRLVAGGSFDAAVTLWDVDRSTSSTLRGRTGPGIGMALSGDGLLVASGSDAGPISLWDATTGALITTLEGHRGRVTSVSMSEDGRVVASASDDATVRLWSAPSGQLLATLRGHAVAIWAVALSGDGQIAASGSLDGVIRLWEVRTGDCFRTLQSDRRYQRLDITGLTGITEAQRATLIALGAMETSE
jgi:WD40 repeat protein/DNA-binding XRE family transcriptional regulator